MKQIVHFVQYHNFFTIAVMVVFMGAGVSFAASPELRQGVLSQTETARSVDNSYVINTDFDNYDMGLKIQSVTEDAGIYYIDYTYNVVGVKDYMWQPVATAGSIKVSKKELSGRDLGLYVADQLGQMIDQQIAYLKEVQAKEKKNGVTQKVLAVEYSGLVGQFLSTDEKTFDGYAPVVTPPPPEQQEQTAAVVGAQDANPLNTVAGQDAPPTAPTTSRSSLTREEVEQLIRARVAELLADSTTSTGSAGSPQDASVSAEATADGEAPVITVNGNNPATIEVGTAYTDLGATVADNVSNNIGITARVDDGEWGEIGSLTLDTSSPATHIVYYRATDAAGNTGTASRTVNVGAPAAEATPVEESPAADTPAETPPAEATPVEAPPAEAPASEGPQA